MPAYILLFKYSGTIWDHIFVIFMPTTWFGSDYLIGSPSRKAAGVENHRDPGENLTEGGMDSTEDLEIRTFFCASSRKE